MTLYALKGTEQDLRTKAADGRGGDVHVEQYRGTLRSIQNQLPEKAEG